MSLTQALGTALAGLNATQAGLSVISGNIANSNTPGYVDQTSNQVEVAAGGNSGSSVDVIGINRNLNSLLQNQLWTETSGGSYADTKAGLYQQLQQVYGTPGTAGAFDTSYNNFTSALQALSTSPSSYSSQTAVLGAAQQLTQNLNSMTGGIQALRSQAEQGIADGVQQANQAMATIAQINQQLSSNAPQDGATATLEDQRDQAVTQLSQLMNISVTKNSNDQITIFTSSGLQLVGTQASKLEFDDRGSLSATSLWNANPAKDGAGTITLASPDGTSTDLLANNSNSVRPDRRLCGDARPGSAAGAEPDRRAGQPDVAVAFGPDDERKPCGLGQPVGLHGRGRRRAAGQFRASVLYGRSQQSAYRHHRSGRRPGGAAVVRQRERHCEQPGDRGEFRGRHGLGGDAAQRRARIEPRPPARPPACCRCSIRRPAARPSMPSRPPRPRPRSPPAARSCRSYRRHHSDQRRHHGDRLADRRAGGAHHRQQRRPRRSRRAGGLSDLARDGGRNLHPSEFPAEPADQGGPDLFADDRSWQRHGSVQRARCRIS